MTPETVKLEVTSVGGQRLFKLTANNADAEEVERLGWNQARNLEGAFEMAIKWCMKRGLKRFEYLDLRPDVNIAGFMSVAPRPLNIPRTEGGEKYVG